MTEMSDHDRIIRLEERQKADREALELARHILDARVRQFQWVIATLLVGTGLVISVAVAFRP